MLNNRDLEEAAALFEPLGVVSFVMGVMMAVISQKTTSEAELRLEKTTQGGLYPDAERLRAFEARERGSGLPEAECLDDDGGFWVFGYGSLLWRPGVVFDRRVEATLHGHERAFCLWSVRYRGTPERPGLVLGVRPKVGVSTWGVAYHVPAEHVAPAREHLHERELVTGAYKEVKVEVEIVGGDLPTGASLRAVTYLTDLEHPQYTGELSLADQAWIIARAHGQRGPNSEYLLETAQSLRDARVAGADIDQMFELEALVRAQSGPSAAGS